MGVKADLIQNALRLVVTAPDSNEKRTFLNLLVVIMEKLVQDVENKDDPIARQVFMKSLAGLQQIYFPQSISKSVSKLSSKPSESFPNPVSHPVKSGNRRRTLAAPSEQTMIDVGMLDKSNHFMDIPMKTEDGKVHIISMEGRDTLRVLKNKVSALLGVHMDQIKIEHDGKKVLRLQDLKGASSSRPIKGIKII